MKKIIAIMAFIPFFSFGGDSCEKNAGYDCMNTPLGKVEIIDGVSQKKKTSIITLNDKVIYKVDSETMIPSNGDDGIADVHNVNGEYLTKKSIIGYWEDYPCHCEKFFMLDLSGDKPEMSNVFFDPASYYIDWVSWGDKNTIISLAGNKYRYEKGKITPIENKK